MAKKIKEIPELSGKEADNFAEKMLKMENKKQIEIDESKIVKGQMKYVTKLMELAKREGQSQTIKKVKEIVESKELLEILSDLEHKQWCHWTKYMIKNIHNEDDVIRWERQMKKSYSELDDEDKEKDKVFANKVIQELLSKIGEIEK